MAVIVAHPDDEILGCGGVMAKLSSSHAIHIMILGEGITSRFDNREQANQDSLNSLTSDAENAAKIVGAKQVEFGGLPDNRFDEVALLDVIKLVERFINHHKPTTIFTHHPGDLNIDHGVTFRSVMTAVRPMQNERVKEVYACEIQSSTEWAFQSVHPIFQPNVFFDISDTIDTKIEAMEAYSSEKRAFPHPRSPESLRGHAQRWGATVGTNYAEAFQLIRSVR